MIAKLQNILFFLLILFLPTQFGKHFWPDFAYVLGQRVDYLSPTVYFTDILVIIFILLSILRYYEKKPFPLLISQYPNILVSKQIPIALLFLFLSIGIYLSINPFAGWYYLLKLFEFILLGVAFLDFRRSIQVHDGNRMLLLAFIIGIIGESLLAISQFWHQGSIGGILYYLGERTFTGDTPGIANASLNGKLVLRPYATFPHPNVLAAYLLIGMTVILFSVKRQALSVKVGQIFPSSLRFTLYALPLIIGTIALFLTLSRIAILLWLIILSFFIGHNVWNRIKHLVHPTYYLLFLPSVLLTMLILLFTFFPDLKYRILTTGLSDESVSSRIELLQSAQQMFIKNPFFGVGFGNFLPNLPLYLSSSHFVQLLQPVHNIFYLIAAETGIPGLLFFLWFLGKTFLKILGYYDTRILRATEYKGIKRLPPNVLISQYLSIALLALVFILGMFDHYFLTLQQGQLLLTLILSMCWVDDVAKHTKPNVK